MSAPDGSAGLSRARSESPESAHPDKNHLNPSQLVPLHEAGTVLESTHENEVDRQNN